MKNIEGIMRDKQYHFDYRNKNEPVENLNTEMKTGNTQKTHRDTKGYSHVKWFIFLILILVIACKQPPPSNNQVFFKTDTTLQIIKLNKETLEFDVELATDDYSKERGLMYRYKLEENQGMFFVFNYMEIRTFWMKNTYISLDMIFIDEFYNIVDIHENAFPLSEETILSKVPAKYVFEIKGGLCKRMNIQIGDKIQITL